MARTLVKKITQPLKNYIINGQFDFFQRVSSPLWVNLGNLYTADRWFRFKQTGGGTGVFTQIQSSSGLVGIKRSMKFGRVSGSTDLNQTEIITALESNDSIQLQGKTVTISFYARKGANFSGANFVSYLGAGTGTDQGVVSAWTGQVVLATLTTPAASISTSVWQRFSYSVNIPGNITQLRLDFNYIPTGTAGADDTIEITGIMMNEGGLVDYTRAGIDYAGELTLCQRYYEKSYLLDHPPGFNQTGTETALFSGRANDANQMVCAGGQYQVTKRVPSGVNIYSYNGTLNAVAGHAGTLDIAITGASRGGIHGFETINASGTLVANANYWFCWTADAEL